MPTDDYTILENPVLLIILAVLIIYLIHLIYKRIHTSPFNYPYLTTRFDVSGKKNPNIENLIDTYINETPNMSNNGKLVVNSLLIIVS